MGFFDKIKSILKPSPEEKAEKLVSRITNMYGQTQDRKYYLYQLRDLGADRSAALLIRRFSCTCENGTVDAEEKELTMNLLVSMGNTAVEPLKKHLSSSDKDFYWPNRALSQLISEEELLEFYMEILEEIGPEYVRDPERKEQLMLLSKTYKNEELARAILPYLGDANETIRFLASDAAITHAYPFDIEALSKRLALEESQRVITHIGEAFKTNVWKIEPFDKAAIQERLPQHLSLTGQQTIK